MMSTQDSKPGPGRILKTVGAITALLTAIAGLIGALTAAGAFDDDEAAPEPTPTVIVQSSSESQRTSNPESGSQQNSAAPEAEPEVESTVEPVVERTVEPDPRTAVTLAYLGDAEGCGLGISIDIGDRSYLPIGNSFVASDVATGLQGYEIHGSIVCPFSGQCEVSGSGTIDVATGRTFFVQWQNVAVGLCDVVLA